MDENFGTLTPPAPPPGPPPSPSTRFGGLKRRTALTVTAVGLVTGSVAGGYLVGHAATSAATPTPSASGSAGIPGSGTFHSNENASHEAGESAQREAQENAGQFPTVP